jgi:hypothetical protein
MNNFEIKQYLEEQDIEVIKNKLLDLIEENENLKSHITFLNSQISKYSNLVDFYSSPSGSPFVGQ